MSNKILISVIGKGNYQKTEYIFQEESFTDDLMIGVLNRIIKPDKVYIIGTDESNWGFLDKSNLVYQKIIIPFGRDDEHYMKIFEQISSINVNNAEIYFDITHGFRSLPYFIFTVFNYFNEIHNAKLKGCYYGMYQPNVDKTPIVDLKRLLSINDWIKAYTVFRKSGSGIEIANLLEEYHNTYNRLYRKQGETPIKSLKNIGNQIIKYSTALALNYATVFQDEAQALCELLNNENIREEIRIHLPQFEIIIPFIIEDIEQIINHDKEWKVQFSIARLYYQLFRYTNCLTILREVIITYIIEEIENKNECIRKIEYREEIASKCFCDVYGKYFKDSLLGVADMRNASGHGGMRESGLLTLTTAQNKINKTIERIEDLLANKISTMM